MAKTENVKRMKQPEGYNPMAFVGERDKGNEVACENTECSPTIFGQARRIRDFLSEAMNNLECLSGRLRQQPVSEGSCDPKKTAPDSLGDVLADCNYLARRLVSVSQELSGIVGE